MTAQEIGYIFQTIGTICLLGAYVPQIVHLLKVKEAEGVSRGLWVVLGSGLFLILINMIIGETPIDVVITEAINVLLIFYLYCLTVYYQNKKLKNKR